jgi:hypothetical protein
VHQSGPARSDMVFVSISRRTSGRTQGEHEAREYLVMVVNEIASRCRCKPAKQVGEELGKWEYPAAALQRLEVGALTWTVS